MFMANWHSCWDSRSDSPSVVGAAALHVLRSKKDPSTLQLLESALERMESMHMVPPKVAAEWVGGLLQVAVAASKADACALLCSRKPCEHVPLQHMSNVLVLAAELVHYSHLQREQRLLVMQHVCKVFSSLAMDASRMGSFWDTSGAAAVKACVMQVLMFAVQLGNEQTLQELLEPSCPLARATGCWQLLSCFDVYILLLTSLRSTCSPRIIQMLCGLRLNSDSGRLWGGGYGCQTPAVTSVSVIKMHQLLKVALDTYKAAKGVSEVLKLLAAWDPCQADPGRKGARFVTISAVALGVLCEQAGKIGDAREGAVALEVLQKLGGPA
jgi:hypothetical protein